MNDSEKVIVRYVDGTMLKGLVNRFSTDAEELMLENADKGDVTRIPLPDVKAVFFVRTFEGNDEHREKKAFGGGTAARASGHKVYIRFKDNESMVGHVKGDVPWRQGFFAAEPHDRAKGFFVLPVDEDANNTKVFVVGTAIKDITVIAP